ncbi:MAG TPA: TonB family protein, partial [Anaeromyxobacteraceae bacterium]
EPPAPPPPNQPPPPDAARAAPPRIGISMESTTTAGAVAAPVGNTLYGRAPERAADPAAVKPYRSERYAPPSQVTTLPEPLGCDIPRAEYPEEARRLGVEGEVRLRVVVDEEGRVREAKVLRDPGHGFGAVAARAARAYCRFRPAQKDGAAVATEIPYTIRFEL